LPVERRTAAPGSGACLRDGGGAVASEEQHGSE
jgi:putative hemolysin